jgi:hypothetical protein
MDDVDDVDEMDGGQVKTLSVSSILSIPSTRSRGHTQNPLQVPSFGVSIRVLHPGGRQ